VTTNAFLMWTSLNLGFSKFVIFYVMQSDGRKLSNKLDITIRTWRNHVREWRCLLFVHNVGFILLWSWMVKNEVAFMELQLGRKIITIKEGMQWENSARRAKWLSPKNKWCSWRVLLCWIVVVFSSIAPIIS